MSGSSPGTRPLVSIVVPIFNEAAIIEESLGSLLNQDAPDFDMEILAIDGMSTDGTQEKVTEMAKKNPRLRLVLNPRRETPAARNIGLQESRGEYVGMFIAHNVFDRDYVAVCLRELLAHGAVGCSGRVISRPEHNSLSSQLCSWTLGHPFGSSRKSFRTVGEGFVDSPGYPILVKKSVVDVGGYDEKQFHNEDNDISRKLRAAGGKLYCTWKTCCYYYGKSTVGSLLKYAFRSGFWNVVSLKSHLLTMGLRHYIPFLFVMGLVISLLLGVTGLLLPTTHTLAFFLPLLAILGMHLGVGVLASIQVSLREKSAKPLLLPPVFFGFHFAYGLGTLWGFLKGASPTSSYRYGSPATEL